MRIAILKAYRDTSRDTILVAIPSPNEQAYCPWAVLLICHVLFKLGHCPLKTFLFICLFFFFFAIWRSERFFHVSVCQINGDILVLSLSYGQRIRHNFERQAAYYLVFVNFIFSELFKMRFSSRIRPRLRKIKVKILIVSSILCYYDLWVRIMRL